MGEYDEFIEDLMSLERWQHGAFATACAERVALICRSFGSPESVALYERGLDMAWRGVIQQDLPLDAKQIIKALKDAPEAEEDVPGAAYYVGRPLGILAFALEALAKNDAEPAVWTSSEGLDFSSELDAVLARESQLIREYPRGEQPPEGPLQALESKYQRQTLELIKSERQPTAELISSLRRLAQDANDGRTAVLTRVVE